MGLSELIAVDANRPTDYNEIGKILQGSLKEMMQARQMRDLAEVVKTLAASDTSARPEPSSPFSVLKDVGFDVQKMIEVNHKVAESALEQAERERQRRTEEEQLALQLKEQRFNEQMSLAEKLLQLQQMNSDKVLELQRQMYESKLQGGNKQDPLSEQLNQFVLTMLAQSLKDRLSPPQPANPLEQIQGALQLTGQLHKIFGGGSSNDDSRLRWELEKMKLEREDARWREEMQARREAEERKARTWENLMSQLTNILPMVAQSIRGGTPAATGVGVADTPATSVASPVITTSTLAETEVICPNCGEDFKTTEVDAPTCPHCHTQLVRSQGGAA